MKKFQTEAKLSKKFQQYNLTARDLERTCCLRIEGLPPKAKEDLLSLYCEKFRVEVQSVAIKHEENAAVVTFQKPEGNTCYNYFVERKIIPDRSFSMFTFSL